MITETDRNQVQRGDTIRWTSNNGTPSLGLAEWAVSDAVHVRQPGSGNSRRYRITWDKVTGWWHGRDAYDRLGGYQ